MGIFVRHEPCPKCGSRDNKAVYDDGSEWCFGCGYYVPPQGILKRAFTAIPEKVAHIALPDDVEPYYPVKTLEWSMQYGIDRQDLLRAKAVWSDRSGLLIFPYFSPSGGLLGWQGRNFGDFYKTKWTGRGDLDSIFDYRHGKNLVFVEDIISAIKVNKAGYGTVPLLGSHCKPERILKALKTSHTAVFWLDHDKVAASRKFATKARLMGLQADVMDTELDPKFYTVEQIKELLK